MPPPFLAISVCFIIYVRGVIMPEDVRQRIKEALARSAANPKNTQIGSYAEELGDAYPGLEDYELHAIRKHGEDHDLTNEEMMLEFKTDFANW
jgi:hypothetical protein